MNTGKSEAFYGTIDAVCIEGSTVSIRCVRQFYYGDGLLPDDAWVWTITECKQIADAQELRGKKTCGFEQEAHSLRVWLDEWQQCVTLSGALLSKLEESRNQVDLIRLVGELSQQLLREESKEAGLRRRIAEAITSLEQKIDRLQRRAEFERQRVGSGDARYDREIEDLIGIAERLREATRAKI